MIRGVITANRDAVQHVTLIACIQPVIGQVKALLPGASPGSQPLGANVAITFPLFPADNPWNTDISGYPVHPLSSQYVASIGAAGHLHPDFGTVWDGAPNGIPYVVVSGDQARVPVTFEYDDESDPGPYPIPPDPPSKEARTAMAIATSSSWTPTTGFSMSSTAPIRPEITG